MSSSLHRGQEAGRKGAGSRVLTPRGPESPGNCRDLPEARGEFRKEKRGGCLPLGLSFSSGLTPATPLTHSLPGPQWGHVSFRPSEKPHPHPWSPGREHLVLGR